MSKTKIIIITIATLVLAGGGIPLWIHFHNTASKGTQNQPQTKQPNDVNYSPPTTEQKNTGDSIKQQSIQQAPTSGSSTSAKNTITISRLSQSGAGQLVSLRTILDNISGDQCVATFSLSGQPTITRTVAIETGPTYYSCEPIDVSANEFSSNGDWQVDVYVSLSGSTISNTATGSIMVQR